MTGADMQTVAVSLGGGRDYNIYIGAGTLAAAGASLRGVLRAKKICIVTDSHIAALPYLPALVAGLEAAGFEVVAPVVLPAGEGSKNFTQLEHILSSALAAGVDRKSAFVALGGGVVGDITGFAAAVLMRGIDFVQIPTTLLAQVDSSVGGKTGINLPLGKNLVGAFCQPRAVFIDTDVLGTLPPREMRAGYAEVLKYALINQPDFFEWLEQNGAALLSGDAAVQREAIAVSCRTKADIVAEDEREEKDIRALLNLGHTFGHALEKIGGYDGRLLHGEAVAIGCLWAAKFSVRRGLCAEGVPVRIENHLKAAGMMTHPPFEVDADDVLAAMRGDKKNDGGRITLILMRGIGGAFVSRDTDEADLHAFLKQKTG
ncbi:MAG TPA: 3-dehydroquinate synthase [Alphaproteobacteria bacterium]|nr:3-dehydroquinate synthase [Alphaproteobacteria bacterium]